MLFFDQAIAEMYRGRIMQLSDHIRRRIKLQDLHVLMTVVQAGSMRKAAAHLNSNQPSISRSIADLERTLGVQLLDRNPQGIEPTQYGRALLDCGAAVFDDLHHGIKSIEFLADPTVGEVRIGSGAFLAASFVSGVVDRLSRRYPRVVFHLVVTQPDAPFQELSERNVDLAIASLRGGLVPDEKFRFEVLYDDAGVVVAGAQSPWARRRSIELAELVNELWALPPPQRAYEPLFVEVFRAHGIECPRATVFTISAEARISLVATGRFLSIVPTFILRFPRRRPEIKILPIKLSNDRVPFGIVTLKNRTLSPVAQLFIEHAREVARTPAKGKR
jgi:DNA-binding transcriptional LysR family regulator